MVPASPEAQAFNQRIASLERRVERLERAAARAGIGAVLTARQHTIAALVAAGLTNAEAAAALSLSAKTIEWNLSRIYRSLGVRSRTELAVRLSPHGTRPAD
jgi:DNA-binding NarL/FixJ family response regulator